jgi:nitroimidazol reductase NimA-like FMN-containing flavoprotein (pyridoxamine 5'-phosphate oxidase superfamily)
MPVQRTKKPTFRRLTEKECRAVLKRHHVGRIAFVRQRGVDIEPISYVFAGDHLVVRTAPGTKFTALRHDPWVAFEVDEIDGPFDWRSVVVHASAYRTAPTGTPADRAAHRRAVERLRTFAPATLRSGDPVPARDIVLRLYITEITGRAASSHGKGGRGARKGGARRRTPPSAR